MRGSVTFFVRCFILLVFRSPTRPAEGGLSPEEVGVLKESSFVNGKLFLPWTDQDLEVTAGPVTSECWSISYLRGCVSHV